MSTFICTQIERDFISKIGAGCSAPVACNAVVNGDNIVFRTMIGFPDGTNIMWKTATALISHCDDLGTQLARDFIDEGAMELLKNAESIAFKDEMPQRL